MYEKATKHPPAQGGTGGAEMGKRYAIVGFGCAGYHGLEALRQSDPGSEIHVFSELDQPPANPMLTTYYAAGRLPL